MTWQEKTSITNTALSDDHSVKTIGPRLEVYALLLLFMLEV